MSRATPRGGVGGGSAHGGAPSSSGGRSNHLSSHPSSRSSHHPPSHSSSRPSPHASPRPAPNSTNHHLLQLRFIDANKKTSRDDVFKISFGKLDAPLTRLNDTNNGFYAVTDDIKTIDKLLTDKAKTELAKINLTAHISKKDNIHSTS